MTCGALLDTAATAAGCGDKADWLSVDLLDDAEVGRELRRVRRLAAAVEARSAELVAEAARRGIPEAEGFGSTTGWLVALTGDPPSVCRSRVQTARELRGMPATREAFAAGELSEPRVRLLVSACQFAPRVFSRDEGLLVGQARSLPARLFPQALAHWRRLADADGALAEAEQALERRRLHVSATWGGMVRLDGDLDPESGAVVITALGSLTEPRALDPQDGRSPAQRRADALVEICRRHLDTSDRPRIGGEKPHLTVTISIDQLTSPGLTDLDTGPITLETVRRLACDATLTPIVTGKSGQPLTAGHRSRVIPPAVRRLLHQRDQHCTHPGCTIPARWCDAHHITHWAHGGPTQANNLQLLCRRHHRMAHHQQE